MATVVLKLGDDVSTDIIYPGRYMATVLPGETPQYAFADETGFRTRLEKGDVPAGSIILGGNNFGCGSSREQAASCLKGHELVVIARHFARIFLQNSINVGLRTVICQEIEGNDAVVKSLRSVSAVKGSSCGSSTARLLWPFSST